MQEAPDMTRKIQDRAQTPQKISSDEALLLLEETLSYFTPQAPVATASQASAPDYVPYAA